MAKEDRIRVDLRGYDVELVEKSCKVIVDTVASNGGKVAGPIPLPTHIKKWTVLRSPHVNKKSREQFEMRTHKRLIDIYGINDKIRDELMKIELSDGVEVEMKG